jgi:hypothetical protein
LVSDELTELRLSDAAGELEETSGNGSFACASAGAGVASCSAGLFRAAEGVILEARSNGAVYGWGNAIRVLPGPVSGLEVTLGTPTVVAGETLSLSVSAFDSFGNRQALLDEDLNGLNFYDEYGDIECRLEDTDGTEHVYTFLCSLYTAGSDNAVSVIASTLGASGIAGPLDVISGPIRNLSMNLDETVITGGITAGEPYVVTIEGRDTFGNLGDGITRVGLADVGGSIEPSSMIIEDGTGVATIVSTVAIEGNSIWGSVDELLAGGTEVFDVLHGDAVDMAASLPVMWAYTGEPLLVEVAVVDAFGNPASGEMHNVTIETGSALMVDVPVQGTRLVELSFPTAGLKDPIVAYTPDWIAETSTFLVGNLCEPAPLTSIDLRGIEDNRLCMGVDGSAHSDAIPIGSPSIHWLLLVDDDVVASGTPSSVSMDWVGRGRRHIESFTLGADLCGWEEEADVFVGGEREITGPVFISGSTDTLTAGDPGGAGVAEIWIQGRTCTGDLASDSIVYLQPMLGRVGSLDEDPLSDTLGGTTIVLESDGEAHFRWTMEDADQGEYGDLLVGTASGSALGQHHIDVIGDAAPPTIWEVDPHGSSEGLAESITIRFSEPMLDPGSASARTALVQLYDPDGSSVALGESTWMSDRSTLYIGLTAPIDTGSGVWELVVQDDFRDLAGNRIDGDWDGISGGEWSTAFGAVPDLDSMMSSCALTTGWFRPDGSDGPGLDAEEVHISGTTSAPSSWWRLDVFSADGTHWYRDETPRSGLSSGLMTWYGRGQTGRVVPNDTYQLELVALDDFRNAGESCVASVVVDNALEP